VSELLSHEETVELIRRAHNMDEAARERLVVKNTALVKSIAKRFLGRGTEWEDLVQIGSVGLIKAIDGYDAAYGVRFSTYAVPMISGEIKRFLRDDGIVKVSRALKEGAMHIARATEELKRALGREPTVEELSKKTGMPPEELAACMEAVREPVSLYEPVFDDSGKTLLMDTLSADENAKITDRMLVEELMAKLPERERRIIELRFFLDRTQSEIAGEIGVSQVQVSRILVRTLQKMRKDAE